MFGSSEARTDHHFRDRADSSSDPEAARAGPFARQSIAEFKKASNELKSTLEEEIRLEEQRSTIEEKKAQSVTAPPVNPTPLVDEHVVARKADQSA